MRKSQPAHSVANSRSCTWDFSLLRTITQIFRITLHLLLLQAAHPPRHFERSRPTFSSRFAPAKRSACAERNLSSSFLGLRKEDLCTISANLAAMNLSSLPIPPALSRLIARNSSAAKCRISPRTLFAVVASNFHVRVCHRSPILRPPLDGQGPDLLGGLILRPSVYPGCSKRGPGERSR